MPSRTADRRAHSRSRSADMAAQRALAVPPVGGVEGPPDLGFADQGAVALRHFLPDPPDVFRLAVAERADGVSTAPPRRACPILGRSDELKFFGHWFHTIAFAAAEKKCNGREHLHQARPFPASPGLQNLFRRTGHYVPAARCFRATLFGKVNDLRFPSLRFIF